MPVSVNFFSGIATGGDAEGDVFFKIDDLIGSRFNDTLIGTFSANVIEGGAGADNLPLLARMCSAAVVLEQGRATWFDDVDAAIATHNGALVPG